MTSRRMGVGVGKGGRGGGRGREEVEGGSRGRKVKCMVCTMIWWLREEIVNSLSLSR